MKAKEKKRKAKTPTRDEMQRARLKADAEFDAAKAWHDSLADTLMETMKAVGARQELGYSNVFCNMFDEWCYELATFHRKKHRSVKEMPLSFFEDPEAWAARNSYQSFEQWVVANRSRIVEAMLTVLNGETSMEYTQEKLALAYAAAHPEELVCLGIVETLNTHRAKKAQAELARMKH